LSDWPCSFAGVRIGQDDIEVPRQLAGRVFCSSQFDRPRMQGSKGLIGKPRAYAFGCVFTVPVRDRRHLGKLYSPATLDPRRLHTLRPLGVAMAGGDVFDPYKD
jgi:hypothetical protein